MPVEVLLPLEREKVSRRAAQVLLWDTPHPLVQQSPVQGRVLNMQATSEEPTKGLAKKNSKEPCKEPVRSLQGTCKEPIGGVVGGIGGMLGVSWEVLGSTGVVVVG